MQGEKVMGHQQHEPTIKILKQPGRGRKNKIFVWNRNPFAYPWMIYTRLLWTPTFSVFQFIKQCKSLLIKATPCPAVLWRSATQGDMTHSEIGEMPSVGIKRISKSFTLKKKNFSWNSKKSSVHGLSQDVHATKTFTVKYCPCSCWW